MKKKTTWWQRFKQNLYNGAAKAAGEKIAEEMDRQARGVPELTSGQKLHQRALAIILKIPFHKWEKEKGSFPAVTLFSCVFDGVEYNLTKDTCSINGHLFTEFGMLNTVVHNKIIANNTKKTLEEREIFLIELENKLKQETNTTA